MKKEMMLCLIPMLLLTSCGYDNEINLGIGDGTKVEDAVRIYLNFNNVAALKGLFNPIVALLLYVCVLLSLLYILCNTFKFFESGFTPLFGALTFPMAIGTLAGFRAGAFFSNIEAYKTLGAIAVNITGFQILISSTFMCLVFFNFVKMYLNSKKE